MLKKSVLGLMIFSFATFLWTDSLSSQDSTVIYDPLKVDDNQVVETLKFEFEYQPTAKQSRRANASAQARKVPIKVYLPQSKTPVPVVMFSHGLGGSREGFKHGGEHWARRGYMAVFIQHPGSDESVWRDRAMGQRLAALKEAASAQNLILRIEDVKAVIDYLEKIERGDADVVSEARGLKSRMDLKRIGMSGHSFGAMTTQMVSGQSSLVPTQRPTDPRIRAAVVLSPSTPKLGQPERSFSQVKIPWMLMTGTKDSAPVGDQMPESRLQVFPALPTGDKYQVVFDGGTHAFLGERDGLLPSKSEPSSHARATVALSTAFWDAYLLENADAKRWLQENGPRSVLAAGDKWERK